ncbi:MAG: hypothetical protein QW566_08875 [Candidatus Jordarchaeales archaeon]
MMRARVWRWDDDLEQARENVEKYLRKRWVDTIRECCIKPMLAGELGQS